jgi:hypothetical protein
LVFALFLFTFFTNSQSRTRGAQLVSQRKMLLTAQFYCITEHYAGRMCNFVCLMLQLSLLFFLCVVMFETDYIMIGSCA